MLMKQCGPYKKRYPMWTSTELTLYKDAEYIWHDYHFTKGQTHPPLPSSYPHFSPTLSRLKVPLTSSISSLLSVAWLLLLRTRRHFMPSRRVYIICTCSHKHTPLHVMTVWGSCIGNLCTSSAPVHTNTLHYR